MKPGDNSCQTWFKPIYNLQFKLRNFDREKYSEVIILRDLEFFKVRANLITLFLKNKLNSLRVVFLNTRKFSLKKLKFRFSDPSKKIRYLKKSSAYFTILFPADSQKYVTPCPFGDQLNRMGGKMEEYSIAYVKVI